jgi:hypothetical protein
MFLLRVWLQSTVVAHLAVHPEEVGRLALEAAALGPAQAVVAAQRD